MNNTYVRRNEKVINLTALIALADTVGAAEIKKEFNMNLLPEGIKEALNEIKADEKKAAARSAAKEIYSLLETAEQVKLGHVSSIRHARNLVEQNKAKLVEIAAAEKFASESSNYLPLYKALGLPVPRCEDDGKFAIPAKATSRKAA